MSSASTQTLVDPRLPTLHAVFDSSELARHLNKVLPQEWGKVSDIHIDVLQYHRASRCTMNIELETETGKHELIGKLYAIDRLDVYRTMKQLSENGFGPEQEFSVPQPLAFIPELKLLVQEKVRGPLATEIFLKGSEDERTKAAEQCALWLARFHAHAPLDGTTFVFSGELIEYWARRLAKRAEQIVDKALLLSNRLETSGMRNNGFELCACHGTYCHYQIILTDASTVTLDWDGFCVAHPTLDVARFIVILQQLALNSQGSLRALNTTAEVFYKTYTDTSRFALEQLPLYKAALGLKHAKDYVKRDDVRPDMANTMLDEGLRILAEEV